MPTTAPMSQNLDPSPSSVQRREEKKTSLRQASERQEAENSVVPHPDSRSTGEGREQTGIASSRQPEAAVFMVISAQQLLMDTVNKHSFVYSI